MNKKFVPKENIEIFCYLYCIETALRELIIDLLGNLDGPRWHKKRLPSDILSKYEDGIKHEKAVKWTQLVPHHPIYYVDLPHLKIIIQKRDNWDDAFKSIFSRKDIISSTISELESIRNKIAHNRKASKKDIEIAKGAYAKLSAAIGEERFNELISKCTIAMNISDKLIELQKEAEKLFHICRNVETIEKIEKWQTIRNEWWFDESYLGFKIDRITNYFNTLEDYVNLARTRGIGYKIESWVKAAKIDKKYNDAKKEFSDILD